MERVIHSKNFEGNKIGVSADRNLVAYLPAGYDGVSKRFPVLYFFPSPMDGYRTLFDKSGAQALLDRAIARGTVRSFILVSVDMTTQLGAPWFVNSPVTGNWEDFVVQELVPYVDASFRTIATRDARGLVGHHMGAYGAIRIGMKHADVFGSIYGMNPVGTGFRRADYGFKASRRAIRSSCALVASSEETSRLRSLSANSSSSR